MKQFILVLYALFTLRILSADEVQTNWNWFTMSLIISNVNLAVGQAIPTSIVISNNTGNRHLIYYRESDPCECGPGSFEIINLSTGKKVKYKYSLADRAGLMKTDFEYINGHNFKIFNCDLLKGYSITNLGAFQVRSVGWFPACEPLTNQQYVKMTTPPITVSILRSDSEINKSTK